MTLVHVRTSVISPLRIEARASIIVVASVVTLTICGSADTNPKTGSFNIDPLRPSACHSGPGDRAEHAGGDHYFAHCSHDLLLFLFRFSYRVAIKVRNSGSRFPFVSGQTNPSCRAGDTSERS